MPPHHNKLIIFSYSLYPLFHASLFIVVVVLRHGYQWSSTEESGNCPFLNLITDSGYYKRDCEDGVKILGSAKWG